MTKTIDLNGNELIFRSPYDPAEVAAIKRVSGARWDKLERAWRIPVGNLSAALDFGNQWGFQVNPDVLSLQTFSPPAPKPSRIWAKNQKLYIQFPYDTVKVTAVKKITGCAWSAANECWSTPLSSLVETLRFAQVFQIPVPPDLEDQQAIIEKQRLELIELSKATDASLDLPPFDGSWRRSLNGELKPFQRAGVAYASRTKKTFIADQQGLGKTLEALATLENLESYPALIVCPPTLLLNWKAEANRFLPHRTVRVQRGRSTWTYAEDEPFDDITIIGWSNIDALQSKLVGFRAIVGDESHWAKNPKAKRTRAAVKIAKKAEVVLLLTGTPITNRPREFASQLQILGRLADYGGEWGFYKAFCDAYQDRWGQWHIDGASNLGQLNEMLRGACYVRRLKADVLPDLDPVRHQRLLVAPDSTVMKEYKKAEADIAAYMAERARAIALELGTNPWAAAVKAKLRAEAAIDLVRVSALKRLAALSKREAIDEWLGDRREEGTKVVVAAHHRDVVSGMADRWGGLKIQGGMSVAEVEKAKKTFQETDAPVIVLSIQAAGVGHTLTAAESILLVELPWAPADVDQVIARLHRIGQEGSVLATYMLAEGTIDETIYELLERKRRVVDRATEGSEEDGVGGGLLGLLWGFAEKGLGGNDF